MNNNMAKQVKQGFLPTTPADKPVKNVIGIVKAYASKKSSKPVANEKDCRTHRLQ
jgi:hypothetical protein